ncbi:hypothetical protein quinque_007663 [Culex quinquefasciatus]
MSTNNDRTTKCNNTVGIGIVIGRLVPIRACTTKILPRRLLQLEIKNLPKKAKSLQRFNIPHRINPPGQQDLMIR